MSLLEIKKAGAPVLKEICAPVERVDAKLKDLLDNMAETMYEANGIGIAAPQVGEAVRMVVIDIGDGLIELVNPKITFREGSETDSEGCLSVPGIFGEVERASKVKVEFLDRRGTRKHITAKGLLARCIQHELDHLEGVLFIDVATSLRKEEEQTS